MNHQEIMDMKKQEWLEKRRSYITGTDAACLLGISKWGSQLSVWLDKRGEAEPVKENEAMSWGKRLERPILQAYADANPENEFVFCDGYELVTNPEFPRLACSLDGWNKTLACPVDAKNIRFASAEWGDEGTDNFPDYYKTQLSVQMAMTGARFAQLAVLFSGQDFRVYNYERDEELIAKINDSANDFWARYMFGSETPTVGGDMASTEWVKKHLAVGKGGQKVANNDIAETVAKLKQTKETIKSLETLQSEYENKVKQWIGDATECPGYFTWKNSKDKVSVDWKSVAEKFSGSEGYEDAVKEATKTAPGARTLRITLK
jgi:putative phage-type endonuclease